MSLQHRVSRILAAVGISSSLLLGTLAGPAMIFGARPLVDADATAIPSAVTPGAYAAFDVRFKNISPSNMAQLFLSATTPEGATLVGVEEPWVDECAASDTDLSCALGALNSGAEITVRVVYQTPTTGSSMNVEFLFSTTGVAGDPNEKSHGDDFKVPGSVILDGTKDYAGAYTATDGQIVSDNQDLHRTRNPQYTQVNAPAGAIAVTVGEGGAEVCPAAVAGTCFGQWARISVNFGGTYLEGFSVILGYKGNIGNANFVHVLTNGTPQYITATCSSKDAPSAFPCKWIETSGGDTIVTLWMTQNGRIKGY